MLQVKASHWIVFFRFAYTYMQKYTYTKLKTKNPANILSVNIAADTLESFHAVSVEKWLPATFQNISGYIW